MRETTTLPHSEHPVGSPWNGTVGNWDATAQQKTLILLHTMDGYLTGTDATFSNPESKRSAHYGIGLNGDIHQYVPEDLTAYHAGKYAVNLVSIGIEHEDQIKSDDSVRSEALYKSSAALVADICKAWNIPCDSDHIKKHNEIVATHCPGGLDTGKIISMAQVLLNQQQTEPKPDITTMTDDETRALQVLKDAFARLKTRDGQTYGNLEGLTRDIVELQPRYLSIITPDSQGKPPVVISNDHFVDINVKAQNFDKIAQHFGYTETNDIDPSLGQKIVDLIGNSTPKTPISTPLPTPVASDLANVISTTGTTPLNSDQMEVSLKGNSNLIVTLLAKVGALYSTLFLSKEVSSK